MEGRHQKKNLIFKQRLNQLMEERHLYPSDVARMTGLPRQSIDSYTQGDTQPRIDAITRIAVAFNVSSDWLLGIKK